MNIYELNRKEIKKLHDEFNKTDFGRRAKVFSIVPFIIALLFIVGSIVTALDGGITLIFDCSVLLSILFGCITQLQYGNMLKDYASTKKEEKN